MTTKTYDELAAVRDRANAAYREADDERNIWACTVANILADGNSGRCVEYAVEQYRAARAEADRLQVEWFDASDAARALIGARLIER